jgi:hypothetical protein
VDIGNPAERHEEGSGGQQISGSHPAQFHGIQGELFAYGRESNVYRRGRERGEEGTHRSNEQNSTLGDAGGVNVGWFLI